mmetsp:Transcript_16641/g.40594  ORF Transcript_16641/g.40594 Transcript_16641/m.40594 type:complete len:217 (+) Transcript_16641:655-1305(+)
MLSWTLYPLVLELSALEVADFFACLGFFFPFQLFGSTSSTFTHYIGIRWSLASFLGQLGVQFGPKSFNARILVHFGGISGSWWRGTGDVLVILLTLLGVLRLCCGSCRGRRQDRATTIETLLDLSCCLRKRRVQFGTFGLLILGSACLFGLLSLALEVFGIVIVARVASNVQLSGDHIHQIIKEFIVVFQLLEELVLGYLWSHRLCLIYERDCEEG